MQGGFSFCGIDIETIGLKYVPTLQQTYVYKQAQYNVNDETFASHAGGYFYGTSLQPKSFTLRCIFEDAHINQGIMSRIGSVFTRGRTGKLIFKQRDWLWYTATVVNVDYSGLTNYMNGYITINLKAYYPFARTDMVHLTSSVSGFALGQSVLGVDVLNNSISDEQFDDRDNLIENTALLPRVVTPRTFCVQPNVDQPVTGEKNFLLYNAGNERACVAIEIAGDAKDGIQITNKTTGQTCVILNLQKQRTTDMGMYIVCDGMNGKTILTNGGSYKQYAFEYHDKGYIELQPAYPVRRNIFVKTYSGTRVVDIVDGTVFDDDTGKYIHIDRQWYKIESVINDTRIFVDRDIVQDIDNEKTDIVMMNEITVKPIGAINIQKLKFNYKPTFR